jgi:predicted  nucleic acid-binding Zn-ribbon protein
MSGQLKALKRVAALDASIFELDDRRRQIPRKLEQIQEQLEDTHQRLADLDAAAKDLRAKTELKEQELDDAEQAVIKFRQQINQAKSNKEFRTLQHEILSKEADNARLEDAVLAQMQKVERQVEQRDAYAKQVREAESRTEAERKELKKELDEAEAQLAELREKRSAATKEVPDDILSKYERLIARRGHTAMVSVVNGVCQGCFMSLRPEAMAQLRKGTELVTCHSCGRILYLEE